MHLRPAFFGRVNFAYKDEGRIFKDLRGSSFSSFAFYSFVKAVYTKAQKREKSELLEKTVIEVFLMFFVVWKLILQNEGLYIF